MRDGTRKSRAPSGDDAVNIGVWNSKKPESRIRWRIDEIIADGGYTNVTSPAVATVLTSVTNGMWLSYLISPKRFDRQVATNAVDEYLRSVFPNHFPLQ